MDFDIKSSHPQNATTLIVGVHSSRLLSDAASKINKASNQYLLKAIRRDHMSGKLGELMVLYDIPNIKAHRVIVIGCGNAPGDAKQYCNILMLGIRELIKSNATNAVNYLTQLAVIERDDMWKIKQAVLLTQKESYVFDTYKSTKKKPIALKKMTLISSAQKIATKAMNEALAIANGITLTRNLANHPANVCTPTYLATQAKKLDAQFKRVKVKVINEKSMERLGMNALLSVSQGSEQSAKLITIQYQGTRKTKHPVVLVGKGVTFDTGGISIKPSASMDEMKYDMCGAATVLGTLHAVATMQLPINVVGVIPATENMPSGSATKPGDIFTTMSGQTIEVLNTDAEGRLILCDALTYSERFKPEVIIDIATLTGACVVALGKHASGLMSNDDQLATELLNAGDDIYDRAWQLPLWDDYQQQLYSPFADIANIGGRDAGTITAACFLSRFTKQYRWAHMDIAGTAWLSGKNKGATGRPVALLSQFILNRCH